MFVKQFLWVLIGIYAMAGISELIDLAIEKGAEPVLTYMSRRRRLVFDLLVTIAFLSAAIYSVNSLPE